MCLIYRRYNNKYHYFNGGIKMKLQDFLDEHGEVKQERFVVDDDSKANWALGKIGELKDELESSQKLAEKEIDKVERWLAKEEQRIGNEIDFFDELLFKYALRLKNKDPKFRTKSLPNGERKSTRLNSSHVAISYAVFCLKKKKKRI